MFRVREDSAAVVSYTSVQVHSHLDSGWINLHFYQIILGPNRNLNFVHIFSVPIRVVERSLLGYSQASLHFVEKTSRLTTCLGRVKGLSLIE